jgi:hypothetical protein
LTRFIILDKSKIKKMKFIGILFGFFASSRAQGALTEASEIYDYVATIVPAVIADVVDAAQISEGQRENNFVSRMTTKMTRRLDHQFGSILFRDWVTKGGNVNRKRPCLIHSGLDISEMRGYLDDRENHTIGDQWYFVRLLYSQLIIQVFAECKETNSRMKSTFVRKQQKVEKIYNKLRKFL